MEFEQIVKKISPVLRRITYKLNGYCRFLGDDDLYQEALVHLWQDYSSGKLTDKTDSYVLQGCYFHLRNYLRKIKDKSRLVSIEAIVNQEGNNFEESLLLRDTSADNFLDTLNSKLLAETIHNNGFTTREKQLLRLFSEGLTTREIGKCCGVSHVRVVKMMASIRGKCKKYLD
ncbi:MAG: sigma-70 family RNA polymerase sigma factor [Candidatus Omnitrophica bacterium]|nr:sigma-70 family RNA polymerase sigma factor [Candidatus Omnitrophota bacterium]